MSEEKKETVTVCEQQTIGGQQFAFIGEVPADSPKAKAAEAVREGFHAKLRHDAAKGDKTAKGALKFLKAVKRIGEPPRWWELRLRYRAWRRKCAERVKEEKRVDACLTLGLHPKAGEMLSGLSQVIYQTTMFNHSSDAEERAQAFYDGLKLAQKLISKIKHPKDEDWDAYWKETHDG